MDKETMAVYLKRFSDRVLRSYSAYALWKSIQESRNNAELGFEKVQKNLQIMNYYGRSSIFLTILSSLEATFIVELHKFFDKRKDVLKLTDIDRFMANGSEFSMPQEDKKLIENILKANQETIDRVKELRHSCFGHDKLEIEKTFLIPLISDLDKLFLAVREILNIIAKNTTSEFYFWSDDDGQDIKFAFNQLLMDLDKGKTQRFEEKRAKMGREI